MEKHGLSLDEFEEMLRVNVLAAKLSSHLFAHKIESLFVECQLDYMQAILYEVVLEDEDLAMELFYAIQEDELNFPSWTRIHSRSGIAPHVRLPQTIAT
jgi:hypothetical protein